MKNNILLIIILILGFALFGLYEFKVSRKTNNLNNFPNNNFPNNPAPPITSKPVVPAPIEPPTVSEVVRNPTSYEEALKTAEKLNKKIVLMFSADWCHWCSKFKSEVLTASSVKEALENYVFLIVDADQNKSILSKFGIRGLPNFYIIDYKENNLKNKAGFMSVDDFISWLNLENNSRR